MSVGMDDDDKAMELFEKQDDRQCPEGEMASDPREAAADRALASVDKGVNGTSNAAQEDALHSSCARPQPRGAVSGSAGRNSVRETPPNRERVT